MDAAERVVFAIREGRIGFQRLLSYTLNMLVKKIEIVAFLAIGLVLTGQPVLTPALMVLTLVTNDFLSMSLTTDRASPAPAPSRWRMRGITAAGMILGVCKLGFSTAVLALGKYRLGLGQGEWRRSGSGKPFATQGAPRPARPGTLANCTGRGGDSCAMGSEGSSKILLSKLYIGLR